MISIRDKDAVYKFPDKINLDTKLLDYLKDNVDEKHYLTIKRIINFTSLEDRDGFIRGTRFRPHDENSPYAYTISTSLTNRVADNFIIVPKNTKHGY